MDPGLVLANDHAVQTTFFDASSMSSSASDLTSAFKQNVIVAVAAEVLVLVWGLVVVIARLPLTRAVLGQDPPVRGGPSSRAPSDTALVTVIGTVDAFTQSKIYTSNYFNLSSVTVVALLFIIITNPAGTVR